jgi:hypothetical protein
MLPQDARHKGVMKGLLTGMSLNVGLLTTLDTLRSLSSGKQLPSFGMVEFIKPFKDEN